MGSSKVVRQDSNSRSTTSSIFQRSFHQPRSPTLLVSYDYLLLRPLLSQHFDKLESVGRIFSNGRRGFRSSPPKISSQQEASLRNLHHLESESVESSRRSWRRPRSKISNGGVGETVGWRVWRRICRLSRGQSTTTFQGRRSGGSADLDSASDRHVVSRSRATSKPPSLFFDLPTTSSLRLSNLGNPLSANLATLSLPFPSLDHPTSPLSIPPHQVSTATNLQTKTHAPSPQHQYRLSPTTKSNLSSASISLTGALEISSRYRCRSVDFELNVQHSLAIPRSHIRRPAETEGGVFPTRTRRSRSRRISASRRRRRA